MDEVTKNIKLGAELALPDELPNKPDLSHLPSHVLRSNAIETLLQQNEELMSRLSVNLRRISHLENTIDDQETQIKKFKHHYEVVKDEVFILKEQTDIAKSQLKDKNTEHNELLAKYKAIDFEYTQLFENSREQKESLLQNIDDLSRRLKNHIKYRHNMKPLINKLKKEVTELTHMQDEYSGQNKVLKDKISALSKYLQEQSTEYIQEKNTLIKQYEIDTDKISSLEKSLEDKTSQLDSLNTEVIKLRNENIQLNRSLTENEGKSEDAAKVQNNILQDFKTKLKELKVANLEVTTEKSELAQELANLRLDHDEITEQLENTQMFFASLQKQFEKEQIKTSSLQKLNRKLSQEMNSYRSTIQSLKNIRDEQEIKKKKPQKETLNKIENLIFEIERDFR